MLTEEQEIDQHTLQLEADLEAYSSTCNKLQQQLSLNMQHMTELRRELDESLEKEQQLQEQVQESESLEFLDKAAHFIAARQAELRGDFQKCYGQGDYGEASSVIAKYKYYESTLESIIRKKAFLVLHNEEPSKKESVAGHV